VTRSAADHRGAASSETLTVPYGGASIEVRLTRADRATLEIAVLPDGTVVATAPREAPVETVLARARRRARWIVTQQRYFAQFQPRTPPRRYVGGETHLYLGRRYRLAIEPGEKDSVKLAGGWLRVTTRSDQSPDHVRRLVERWYADKARARLTERLDACWERFPAGDLDKPPLRIRRMRSRWGSMSPSGALTLNVDLIRAPRESIDYVIVHELCHLAYPGHGPEFRLLLERVMPDWRRRKHRLELTLA